MDSNGDILLFLGRWHPLLVHLPIGMLVLAFCFALLSRKKGNAPLVTAIPTTLLLGACSATLASVSGYLLSLGGGYDAETLSLHQWLGIGTTLVSALCWWLYRTPVAKEKTRYPLRKFRFAFLTGMVALLCTAGHFGGTLTHGEGYLAEALPAHTREWFGWQPDRILIDDVQEAAVYEDIIQPIFKQRCQSCHGPKKQEGDLALHTWEMVMKGGENGPVIAAGSATESELYRRLALPEGDDDRMPPKGRTPISEDQIKLIAWWIGIGAPTDQQVKAVEQPEEIYPVLLALESGGAESPTDDPRVSLADIPAANAEAVEQLRAKGVKIVPLAASKNQLAVNAVNYPEFNDEDARILSALGENVVQLKLGGTKITDGALQHIGRLTGLQQLHLEHTAVGDGGLAHLETCEQLSYLNLFHTKVTDDGLRSLARQPALRKVYLYQTPATREGVAALARSQPLLEIDTGGHRLLELPTDTMVYR